MIETLAGKSGKQFCTASARKITGSDLPPVVYVNVVSHNVNYEDNTNYPDFLTNTTAFWEQRNSIAEFAKMCYDEGVKYNFETDWNFLMALDRYDTPMAATNNKTLLKYLTEDLGFEVDASLHGSKYNHGDMGYLFDKQGITNAKNVTVGGFIAAPPDSFLFDNFKNGVTSTLSPSYVWRPQILHAPATYRHRNEDTIMFSGLWKPKSKTEFTIHDYSGPLTCVGISNGDINGVLDLLVKQENGQLEQGKIYSATIFQTQNSLDKEAFRSTIRSFAKYVSEGKMKWVSIKELADLWAAQYNSEPNKYLFNNSSPILKTDTVTSVSTSGATLKGWCMPNSSSVTLSFEYGLTTSLGSSIAGSPAGASGSSPLNYTASLTGLAANTKYYYRGKITGTFGTVYGLIKEFTTNAASLTAPVLINPTDNRTNVAQKPAFSWGRVSGSASYTLQAGTSVSNWTSPVVNITGITDTTKTLTSSLSLSTIYFWRVQAVSGSTVSPWSAVRRFTTTSVIGVDKEEGIPSEYNLYQNYPNPFNPVTTIKYALPKASNVLISIYDALGREVYSFAEGEKSPGYYQVKFDAGTLPSGIYLYKITAAGFAMQKKMILIK